MAAVPSFFSADAADDVVYRNLKGSVALRVQEIRAHCEALWQRFFPYADEALSPAGCAPLSGPILGDVSGRHDYGLRL